MKQMIIECIKCETRLFHEWFKDSEENICEFCKPKEVEDDI